LCDTILEKASILPRAASIQCNETGRNTKINYIRPKLDYGIETSIVFNKTVNNCNGGTTVDAVVADIIVYAFDKRRYNRGVGNVNLTDVSAEEIISDYFHDDDKEEFSRDNKNNNDNNVNGDRDVCYKTHGNDSE